MDGELSTRGVAARSRARDGGVASGEQQRTRMRLIGIKTPPDQHDWLRARLRAACAREGVPSATLLELMLDDRERLLEQRLADAASGRVNPLAV